MDAPSMRKGLILAGLGAILLLFPSPSRGLDIQMRLSSGLWKMNLGEINDALAGWREGLKRESDVDPAAQFAGGEWNLKPNWSSRFPVGSSWG
jgi:hypothetical protein